MCSWGFILFEIFAGEAGKVAASGDKVNKYVKEAFQTMRFIVTVGWSIYPLGYFFGYLKGSVNDSTLNLLYNLADLVNKIAFVLAVWVSAKASTVEETYEIEKNTMQAVAAYSSHKEAIGYALLP